MRIVHLLNWDLKSIEKILDDIKRQGFDAVQINTMQPLKEEEDFHWWLSYQPLGFRIGNMYGTKEDLISLCKKANEKEISIIVDVVANHTANKSGEECLTPHPSVDLELLSRRDFWKDKKMMKNGDNRYDATHGLIGLPGLDLKNKDLKKIIFRYLKELKDCGVKGFRFDAAKHIGLPNDGVMFFSEVSSFLDENNLFAYGEFLGGDSDWQNEFMDTLPILTHFTSKVKDYSKMTTFIESHDTFLNDCFDSTRMIKTGDLCNLYALLNNKFQNTIWYVRPIYYPYNPYGKAPSKLNLKTLDYFELDFLTDKRIKEANTNKQKVLTLR